MRITQYIFVGVVLLNLFLCVANSQANKWHGVQIVDVGKAYNTRNQITQLVNLSQRNHKAATFRVNADISTDRGSGRSTMRYDRPTKVLSIYAEYPIPNPADSNLTSEETHHVVYSGVTDATLVAALEKTDKNNSEGSFFQEFEELLIKRGCKKLKEKYS